MPELQALSRTKPEARRDRLGLMFAGVVAIGVLVAAVAGVGSRSTGDQPLSPQAQQERLLAFQRIGPLGAVPMPPADRAAALATMNLAGQPAEVRTALENGSEPLTWLTLWDDRDEDGDTVEITSHGFSRTIRLTNAPIRIAVPVPEGGVINIRGVYDGGGGITVAIRTTQGHVALPIMAVGQVVGVPVQVGP